MSSPPAAETDLTLGGVAADGFAPADSQPRPLLLAWWQPAAGKAAPPQHTICWAAVDGTDRGKETITSPAHRLDRVTVLGELRSRLGRRFPDRPVSFVSAHRVLDQLAAADRMSVAGHHLARLDLIGAYGSEVVGVVQVQISREGLTATVGIERTLSLKFDDAAADWAERAITGFAELAGRDKLAEAGWTELRGRRWQIVGRQTY